jgi:hypothetical protein
MKIKEFKSFIREEIIGVLSETTMVGPQTTSDDIPAIAKSEKTSPSTVKAAIDQAKKSGQPIAVAEDELEEMARAKVSYILNKEMKDELASLIEKAKGNVKKALEYLLDKGEMSVADVAKEFGLADTASINNPKFRELMGMLKDKGVVSMAGIPAVPKAATTKPSKEKIEKAVKAVEKDMETGEEEADDYYKAGDEDSAPEESDIDKQAAKAATKLTKRTSKLDKVLKGLIQVEKEMKELAGEYKNAEGEEKANIIAKLKEKTAQKKELEALKDKFEFDVV